MEGCNFLPGHAEALMVNPNPSGEGSMGLNYPEPDVTQGRNHTISGRFRGISVVSVTSYSENGTATSSYSGIGIGAGPGASTAGVTSYSWGSPYGPGLRISASLGSGRWGESVSVFGSADGVNISRGTGIGIVRSGANITAGVRTRAQ